MNRTIMTPIYVKMDAPEHLLLYEGVCHQLGILTYHPEVLAAEPGRKVDGVKPKCRVPTVRVQLVQSMRLLPNQSVLADVELIGEGLKGSKTPLLLEPYPSLEGGLGIQVAEAVVQPSGGVMGKVLLTNCLGFTQGTEPGLEIGTASPVEVVDLASSRSESPHDSRAEEPDGKLHETNKQYTEVNAVASRESREEDGGDKHEAIRKRKLRELMAEELPPQALPEQQAQELLHLLEDYHNVFCLEEGNRGETDLVQLHIDRRRSTQEVSCASCPICCSAGDCEASQLNAKQQCHPTFK